MGLDDYANVASVEPLLQRHFDGAGPMLQQRSCYIYDFFRNKAKKGKINPMGTYASFELYGNPNVGAGSAADGFRQPGSPGFGGLQFFPVGTHITGGIDGDTMDALENSGMPTTASTIANRITGDLKVYKNERERNFFHGASGERAVVDVATTAITYSAATNESTIVMDDEWGVRHLNEGGVYQFYEGSTLRGSAAGHKCTGKTPSSKSATFLGDLTAATLGAGALITGVIVVNYGCYNKERDGLVEFLGDSGVYAGGDRDAQFRYRGTRVTASDASISVTILEKCDTINRYIDDLEYDAKSRVDITSPTGASQLATLAYANYSINQGSRVAQLGFDAVKYKDRMLMVAHNCSWKEWYQLDMRTMRTWSMRELGLFQNKAASTIHETRSAEGTVEDRYHWVWYEKGQDGCVGSRLNLLLHSIGAGASDKGHVN